MPKKQQNKIPSETQRDIFVQVITQFTPEQMNKLLKSDGKQVRPIPAFAFIPDNSNKK